MLHFVPISCCPVTGHHWIWLCHIYLIHSDKTHPLLNHLCITYLDLLQYAQVYIDMEPGIGLHISDVSHQCQAGGVGSPPSLCLPQLKVSSATLAAWTHCCLRSFFPKSLSMLRLVPGVIPPHAALSFVELHDVPVSHLPAYQFGLFEWGGMNKREGWNFSQG